MTITDVLESVNLARSFPMDIESCYATVGLLTPMIKRLKGDDTPLLVQEGPGFQLAIAPDIRVAGRSAAQLVKERYKAWLENEHSSGGTEFRQQYFTIAVGGGNTVKNEYKALLRHHFQDIQWLEHVRFFFLEESCNAQGWESARDGLVSTFIEPLAKRLTAVKATRRLTDKLGLKRGASNEEILQQIRDRMIYPIDMKAVARSARRGNRSSALEAAEGEARRYQSLLRELLGPSMSFHMIITGISKDGGLGAFTPYTNELRRKKPATLVLEKPDGAISVALNRGILTAADCISLIISGSHKLRALGRFEMEDSAGFEQTVMETPIRMLRETREIAEKVHIFADDRALLFEEGVFEFSENGKSLEVKSEVREGNEKRGVHILLVHGFMGLYSYINLLIRLPSAWKVSALRRGSHAKTLPDDEVFPHYASVIRKMILKDWRSKRPTPICCHSMAGIISDHLLLSMLENYDDDLPDFERLKPEDRRLIEAMRAGGIILIATWAPSDTCHITRNIQNLRTHRSEGATLDFSGPKEIYEHTPEGRLRLNREHAEGLDSTPRVLEKMMKIPGIERMINGFNFGLRQVVKRLDLQKLMKQKEAPYGQRLLSSRVLQKVSFYGVLKEVNAAMHQPEEYQRRHLKALDAIIKYDIPYLVIVHRDDFMVSANRHLQEHEYLLAARLAKEGVKRERDLATPARLILLKGETEEPPVELVDPHFLILSHSHKGSGNARKVTAAITEFVNDNVARAIRAKRVSPLDSVDRWAQKSRRAAS